MKRVLVLAVLAAAGCAEAATQPQEEPDSSIPGNVQQVSAGAEVILRPGSTATVRGTDLRVTFRSVAEDSRCPIDAICVSPGDAVAALELSAGGANPSTVELHTFGEPRSVTFAGYRVDLLEVAPSRQAKDTIDPSAYRVRLKVERQ